MMTKHNVVRRLAACIALAVLVGPSALSAADPLELPMILPLTGNGAFIGHEQQQAAVAAAAYINKTGGIRGRPVSFDIEDSQSNPQVALQLVQALRAKHVQFILGPTLSAECGAMLPVDDKDGPVTYCFSNAVRPPAGSYVFSAIFSTADMILGSLRYFRGRGWKKIAYIVSTDATGQDAERAIDADLALPENKDVEVVVREHFGTSDLSVAAQMSRIKAANPQALIAWAAGTAGGTLLHGAFDAGVNLPTVSSAANLNANVLKQWNAFLPTDLLFPGSTAAAPEAANTRAWKAAVATFDAAVGSPDVKPDQVHAATWDPLMLVLGGLRKYGPDVTQTQLRDYLASTKNWAGALGIYDFPAYPQRGLNASDVVMIRWDTVKESWSAVSTPGGTPVR
jgi:branched-chain amino acid transport system substrate-binding protein